MLPRDSGLEIVDDFAVLIPSVDPSLLWWTVRCANGRDLMHGFCKFIDAIECGGVAISLQPCAVGNPYGRSWQWFCP